MRALHPALDTPRLRVRLAEAHEAEHIVAYYTRNEPHLRVWEPERPGGFFTLPFWKERIALYEDQSLAGTSFRFFLFANTQTLQREVGTIVGSISLTQIERGAFMCGRLGFSVDAAGEGRGLMREALAAVVNFGFQDVGLHRIEANHQPQNLKSAALLKRLGFEIQGYARDYLFISGAWRDHVLTARTSPGQD